MHGVGDALEKQDHRSRVLRRFDPAAIGAALTPRRRNLAYIAVWTVVFAIMQVQTGSQLALARADALLSDGPAIARYRELARNEPEYARGHNNLGFALLSVGRPAEAVPPLRRAVELEPDNAEAYNFLAFALTQANRLPEAVETLRQAVLLRPDYHEGHFNLARVLATRGEGAEAVDEFREALRIRPDAEAALRDLALLLATDPAVDVRDPTEAVRLASRAAELTEWRDPLILDVLAGAYSAARRFEDAIQTAEMAESLAADSAPALASLIEAHLSLYRQGRPLPLTR